MSIVIGGTGLFVVLTKFNLPELNMSFWGENPFAIKRDAIDNVMTWIFTSFALIGLLIQVGSKIWGYGLAQRLYSTWFYVSLFVIAVVISILLVVPLTAAGRRIAMRYWLPTIVEKMTEAYSQARFIVDHDGWRQDQLNVKDTLSDAARYQQANFDSATKTIAQIEKLLEIPSDTTDLKRRMEKLRPYLEQR